MVLSASDFAIAVLVSLGDVYDKNVILEFNYLNFGLSRFFFIIA